MSLRIHALSCALVCSACVSAAIPQQQQQQQQQQQPTAFHGKFVSGLVAPSNARPLNSNNNNNDIDDDDDETTTTTTRTFAELLDIARRQYSSSEVEFQSVNQLYRGDWDGVMEGPTWGAWWTQNSFGPTMAGLPFMGDVTYAAHFHSMNWWFDGIGDGKVQGMTREGPAPDGCLCDAAMPCAPRTPTSETCAYYKQGDGLVPLHDWTIEETLSGVMMMAEMLLISRNVTGVEYFMPLFLRTSDLLETRRDPATLNTTFLTGPSTNLLAPSYGGGPNGTKAYLAGVSITYTAALNRLIELSKLLHNTTLETLLTSRRNAAMAGLGKFLTTGTLEQFAKTSAEAEEFHKQRVETGNAQSKDSCTPAGDLCGSSAPSAPACCGNATCRQPYNCGGAPPPPDQSFQCYDSPPPPPPGCHAVGDVCEADSDCCPDPICHRIYCDTNQGKCAESPPPPAGPIAQSKRDPRNLEPLPYFMRALDPTSSGGAQHGVLGASQFGYFSASANHDAVAWRVVNDSLAESIMSVFDHLDKAIRPEVFVIPNTDAGGGGGYDDMLCGDGSTYCDGITRGGIFGYGTWVNGGAWTTEEARAILAYFRTNHQANASASFETMLRRYSSKWTMDAPLTEFGANTWAHLPVMLTIDAFGCAAGMLRGLFEYLYSATSLTLLPHLPDSLTALSQDFGIRWGPYRLFISTAGVRSSGIASATMNGTPLPGTNFNATAITLDFASMPAPSAAAVAATTSDVSTASDRVDIHITFKSVGDEAVSFKRTRDVAAADIPTGYTLRFRAADLAGTHKPGDAVSAWVSSGSSPVTFRNASGYATPVFGQDAEFGASVVFPAGDPLNFVLEAPIDLPATSTIVAVFRDEGTTHMYSPLLSLKPSFRGLTIDPLHCATGNPPGPHNCTSSSKRTVAVDYSGSGDHGIRNISGGVVIGSVSYGATTATSAVGGCSEQVGSQPVNVPASATGETSASIGLRLDGGYHRQFRGSIFEIVAYPRTLAPSELQAVVGALQTAYKIPKRDCTLEPAPAPSPPKPTVDCATARATLNCNNASTWPRKCGLSSSETARLTKFMALLEVAGEAQTATLPYAMAKEALEYSSGFDQRCAALANGTLTGLPSEVADEQSLTLMLTTSGNLFAGLDNALTTRYSAETAEPLAKVLAATWAKTAP